MHRIVLIVALLCITTASAPGTAGAGENAGPNVTASTDAPETAEIEFDQPPTAVKTVPPDYPESARKRGQEGTVYVRAVVTVAGRPERVVVSRGIARDLDQAAVRAIRQWRFEPARKDGKPVAAEIMIPIAFRLAAK